LQGGGQGFESPHLHHSMRFASGSWGKGVRRRWGAELRVIARPTQSARSGATNERAPSLSPFPFLLVFLAVGAIGLELVRPFKTAPIAFDTAASVLHFERMASGRHLEAFLTTTPKPLLTAVDGLLYALSGEWRPISWATIAAFAAAAAIAAYVAARLDGWLAASFVAVGLAASRGLWADVGLSLATAWALLGLAVAAMAITRGRPRYGIAGVAILLASLARVESLVLVPIAFFALSCAAAFRGANAAPTRRAWLVPLIPALAIPIMLVHDWLVTGDPLFWAGVAQQYSATVRASILSPGAMAGALASHGVHEAGLLVLGAIGVVRLARGRSRALAIGLVGLCLGVSTLLILLAARHLYVPDRYFLLIDAALIVAAGFGASAVGDAAIQASLRVRSAVLGPSGRAVAAAGAGLVLAIIVGWPVASLDTQVRSAIRNQARLAEHFATVLPSIRAQLHFLPYVAAANTEPPVRLYVPVAIRPRAVVDTGLLLTQVGDTPAANIDRASWLLGSGQLVFHDRLGDLAPDAFQSLKIAMPTSEGSFVMRPLAADPAAGYWLVLVLRGS
jgi:hypothetical protein